MVVVGGEPGIGKTRLVSEFTRVAHDGGAVVLLGQADEYINVPFRLASDVLRPLVSAVPVDLLEGHVADHGVRLERLVPELPRRVAASMPIPPVFSLPSVAHG